MRKAGGVYYTPTYIVDYIVRQTVGHLAGQKKISRGASLTLRVLDPACGSGSFLLGAYQFLLDWHLEQYGRDPVKWSKGKQPRLYQAAKGVWNSRSKSASGFCWIISSGWTWTPRRWR